MHAETPLRSTSYFRAGLPGILAIAIAIAILAAGTLSATRAQDLATPVVDATPVVSANICDATAPGVGAEPWVRTELYFGTSIPDSDDVVSAEEWNAFLDEEITPRFPAGLTVLEGYGQFLNSQGVIAEEDSIVLILFYPGDAIDESSAGIEEIRDAYEVQFEQESVLRVDSEPVCVSF